MKKITVTIDEEQDKKIHQKRLEMAQDGKILNYSKVLRMIIDKGLT